MSGRHPAVKLLESTLPSGVTSLKSIVRPGAAPLESNLRPGAAPLESTRRPDLARLEWTVRLAVLFALILLLAPVRRSTAQGQAVDYEASGDSLYSSFQNEQALEAYHSALEAQSPTFDLLTKLARTANDVALDEQAAGNAGRAQEMFDEAVSYSKRLTDSYPDSAGSWFMHAATTGKLAQFRGGKAKVRIGRDVEEYYKRSISLDSTYALAYLVGGIFNREVAQLNWVQRLVANTLFGGLPDASLEESKRLLRKAVDLRNDHLLAHWELAQTCLAMDHEDEALAHLRYISELQPQNTEEVRVKKKAAALLDRHE